MGRKRQLKGAGMSDAEYEALVAALKRLRAEQAGTPEKARRLLREEGIIDEHGELTAPYADEDAADEPRLFA